MQPERELLIRKRGEDVAALQNKLRMLGFKISDRDGYFGKSTRSAVMDFQKKHGFPESGIVDNETYKNIDKTLERLGGDAALDEKRHLVRGQVRYRKGRPISKLIVRAFNEELKSEDRLGEAKTDEDGHYEIWYTPDQFSREGKTHADLVVRAYQRKGRPPREEMVAESRVIFSARTIEKVRLFVDGGTEKAWSEYEQLHAEIKPRLEGVSPSKLTENKEKREISFISGQTGQDPILVATYVVANKLASRTNIEPEIFYGMAREGLTTNLSGLLTLKSQELRKALESAIKKRIIPGRLESKLDKIIDELKKKSADHAEGKITGTKDYSLGELLGTVLPTDSKRAAFIKKYLAHAGPVSEFWETMSQEPDYKDHVQEIQIAFQLGALTGNHVPLVQELQKIRQEGKFSHFLELAQFDENDWEGIISNINVPDDKLFPPTIPGKDKQEKIKVFAKTIARIIRDTIPFAIIAYRAKDDQSRPAPLRKFFDNLISKNIDLQLDRTRIAPFIQDHPDLLRGILGNKRELVVSNLEAMQRICKLTTQYSEMRSMLDANVNSSMAAAEMDQGVFINQFKSAFGSAGKARFIHEKARYVAATATTLFAEISPTFNRINIRVLPPPKTEGVPNLETLFGSLDLCDCKECRSVHGPAAYLMEILAFLKARKQKITMPGGAEVNTNAKNILFQRRLDLGTIELTCENITTPLPYVDLVNEILENVIAPFEPIEIAASFASELDGRTISTNLRDAFSAKQIELNEDYIVIVINQGRKWFITDYSLLFEIRKDSVTQKILVENMGYQTSDSAEMLSATPEHFNAKAYERIRTAIFPQKLPLDLWWEEARSFFGHLGTPRPDLMREFLAEGAPVAFADSAIATEYLDLSSMEGEIIAGGRHVRVATTASIASLAGLAAVDGVTVSEGDLVLVKNQASAAENGIYTASSGAWQHPQFIDPTAHVVYVEKGGANTATLWLLASSDDGDFQAKRIRPFDFWGLEQTNNEVKVFDPNNSGATATKLLGWLEALSQVRVLLKHADIEYETLLDMFETKFINPNENINIVSADPQDLATCDTSRLVITNLTAATMNRIHRFLRLWRKLGWKMSELDNAIMGLQGSQADINLRLNETLLVQLANIKRLNVKLKLPVKQILCFWANITHEGEDPLYDRLFQNPTVMRPVDQAFKLKGAELAIVTDDPAQAKISLHSATIMAALGITANDLAELAATVVTDDQLNLTNLSTLYRCSCFARGLNISVRELITLKALAGIELFDLDYTENAIWFHEILQKVKSSGFDIATLEYLLSHRHVETSRIAPVKENIALALDEIRGGLLRVRDETTIQPDPNGSFTTEKLSLLGWHQELILSIVDTLNGRITYREALAAMPAGAAIPDTLASRVSYDATSQLLKVVGPLSLADKQALDNVSSDSAYRQAVDKAFKVPREYIARTMKAFEVPTFSTDLTALPAGLEFPTELRNRIYYDSPAQKLCFTGMMMDSEKAILDGLSSDVSYTTAIQNLDDAFGAFTPDPANQFLNSADETQLFDIGSSAETRFELVLKKLLDFLRTSMSKGLVSQSLSEDLDLETRTLDQLLNIHVSSSTASGKMAMDDFLAKDFAESNPNVELTASAFPRQFKTYTRLFKISLLIKELEISSQQLSWLPKYTQGVVARRIPWIQSQAVTSGWLDFNDLPVGETADTRELFAAWLRLVALCQLRDQLQFGETVLPNVLGLARETSTPLTDLLDSIFKLLEDNLGWKKDDLAVLVAAQGLNLTLPDDFKDEHALVRLNDCCRRMRKLGASASQCLAWAKPLLTYTDAKALRHTTKAKYPEGQWLKIAKPLQSELREKQRAALVAYLVTHPNKMKDQTWDDENGLYEHFLIDVQMSPCFMTSRIKQALSSVQLFVQRCLMNLEQANGIVADDTKDPGWKQWKWMKNFRVWEANRKVFLYPENWIEPELLDIKSPIFKTLESELLQDNITSTSAEDAFRNYLANLDNVAHLEIAGMYRQSQGQGQPEILHVFGCTHGTTPVYYYRNRVGTGRWTAWERIDLDISEPQIIPIIWNRRLYLFWPVFTQKVRPKFSDTTPSQEPEDAKYFEIQMAWSEYKNNKWQPKNVTSKAIESDIVPKENLDDHGKSKHVFRAKTRGVALEIWYESMVAEAMAPGPYGQGYGRKLKTAKVKGFRFSGCDLQVRKFTKPITGIFCPHGTKPDAMMFIERISSPLYLPTSVWSSEEGITLDKTPGSFRFRLLYPYQDGYITGARSFFYQDGDRVFHIVPKAVKVLRWIWKVAKYVRPDHIELMQKYYYGALPMISAFETSSTPFDPLPIEEWYQKNNPTKGMFSAETSSLGMNFAGTPMIAGEAMEESIAEKGALVSGEKWMIARGERTLLSISEFVDEARIYKKDYIVPVYSTVRRYTFHTHYHPYICPLTQELERYGVNGLLKRNTQLRSRKYFNSVYSPTKLVEMGNPMLKDLYPLEDIDFKYEEAYSQYNWELFFHIPILIASRLSQNQRFEEAQEWFHYIFDPTDTSETKVPQKYWRTRPFYEMMQDGYYEQRIDKLLEKLAKGEDDPALTQQVAEWRNNPFKPYAVARLRIAAFQKMVVRKYLDNLIEWGDQLFRRDSIESINEATQLFILAADILGPRPKTIPPRAEPQVQTSNSLDAELEQFSNRLVDIEYMIPNPSPDSVVISPQNPPLPLPKLLYFCVPSNKNLLDYWDVVADRLFKIRNCMNIQGVVRQLPLFQPPIDPAMLVRAAAAGIDLSSALNDINVPLPNYRFRVISQKATELCGELKSLAGALLSALEKKDAEELGMIRATQESSLLRAIKDVRKKQIEEAEDNVDALKASREQAVTKYLHYQKLLGVQDPKVPEIGEPVPEHAPSKQAAIQEGSGVKMVTYERIELSHMKSADDERDTASDWDFAASIAHAFPNVSATIEPWGVGGSISFGGSNVGSALSAVANRYRTSSDNYGYKSSRAAKLGHLVMRAHDWVIQNNLTAKEIMQIDTQIAVAEIRVELAKLELKSHEKQIDNAREVYEFMRDKYTNKELYSWMIGQISGIYFQAYQSAYDVTKRAERAFGFELGLQDSNFIQFGYWDSLKKGLLAGERLYQDLKRMDVSYLVQNKREFEITKHVSLSMLNPEALVLLREKGSCFFDVPEAIYDLDHPGHYMRRIKSVSLTVPCVTGPYTSVSCKLTLLSSRIRKETSPGAGYAWQGLDDDRFIYNLGGIQSIVTSSANQDSGVFELSFNDDRYLPFEGAGAISSWRMELPDDFPQFDYSTISDAILHVRYTARDGGDSLRSKVSSELTAALKNMEIEEGKTGLFRIFRARHDFPNEWHRFLYPPSAQTGGQSIEIKLTSDHFPAYLANRDIKIEGMALFIKSEAAYDTTDPLTFSATPPEGGQDIPIELKYEDTSLGGLSYGKADFSPGIPLSSDKPWLLKITSYANALSLDVDVNGTQIKRLDPALVEDIGILCRFTFS